MLNTLQRLFFITLVSLSAFSHANENKNAEGKSITIIVPVAPGAGNDAMARIVAQKLSAQLNQTVIVDNKAGANGAIAAEYVARAPADGHTLMFGYVATHAMNPALQKLRYDPISSFEPIGLVSYSPIVLVVNAQVKAKDVKELVAHMQSAPEKFSFASAGNGTGPHFAAELFKLATQTAPLHVPYKGAAPAITDTISGQTQFMFSSLFTAQPFIKSGKIRALAIAGKERIAALPDVPTLKEMGIAGVEIDQWYGLLAPAKTPKDIIVKLNAALNHVLNDKDVVRRIEEQGAKVETSTPEAFAALIKKDFAKWKNVVQQAKLHAD